MLVASTAISSGACCPDATISGAAQRSAAEHWTHEEDERPPPPPAPAPPLPPGPDPPVPASRDVALSQPPSAAATSAIPRVDFQAWQDLMRHLPCGGHLRQ